MRKLVMMVCAAVLLSGCQSDQSEAPGAEVAEAETTAVSERVTRQRAAAGEASAPTTPQIQGDPTREIPRLQGQFDEPGLGLTHMVDGSSPDAFAQSLVLIASETSAEQYRELDSALRFLRMYSSAAWGGLPGLYQSLDNMTGEEIIQHARRLQAERRQR